MAVWQLGATQTWLRPLKLKVSNVNWCWLNTIVPHYWLALIETSNTMLSAIRSGLARAWQQVRLSAIFCLFSHIIVLHSEVRRVKRYVFNQSLCILVLAAGGSFNDLNECIWIIFCVSKPFPFWQMLRQGRNMSNLTDHGKFNKRMI